MTQHSEGVDRNDGATPGGESAGAPKPAGRSIPRGRAAIAWAAIVLVGAALVSRSLIGSVTDPQGTGELAEALALRVFELQSKLYIAAADQSRVGIEMAYTQSKAFNTGSYGQRQRYVVLAYELGGIDEASACLDTLDEAIVAAEASAAESAAAETAVGERNAESSDAETAETDASAAETADADRLVRVRTVQDALRRLYDATGAAHSADAESASTPGVESLDDSSRDVLVDELGWLGRVALLPPTPAFRAERTALLEPLQDALAFLTVGVIALVVAGICGFVGLVLCLLLAVLGKMRSGLDAAIGHGGIYAETFAIWLVVFFALQMLAGLVADKWAPDSALALAVAGFFVSLLVLRWPVQRGVPWSQVRRDIGLESGRAHVLEPFIGVACYFMALPMIVVGLLGMLLLALVVNLVSGGGEGSPLDPTNMPVHPIILSASGGAWQKIQLVVALCVAAPIVEEIAFRGLLYRHLRESTRRVGVVLSVIASGLVTAFVFAAIHPQGLLAVPVLMSLAFAFCLTREWRGTLVPCVVMHAMNNGLAATMLLLLFSK